MKLFKVFSFLLILLITISSCTKVEEELVGNWTYHAFGNQSGNIHTWKFLDNGELIRILETENDIFYDSCNYIVEQSLTKKRVVVSNSKQLPGLANISGEYRVDKFKDNIFIMTRTHHANGETNGAYLRCEFTRMQ